MASLDVFRRRVSSRLPERETTACPLLSTLGMADGQASAIAKSIATSSEYGAQSVLCTALDGVRVNSEGIWEEGNKGASRGSGGHWRSKRPREI